MSQSSKKIDENSDIYKQIESIKAIQQNNIKWIGYITAGASGLIATIVTISLLYLDQRVPSDTVEKISENWRLSCNAHAEIAKSYEHFLRYAKRKLQAEKRDKESEIKSSKYDTDIIKTLEDQVANIDDFISEIETAQKELGLLRRVCS